MKLLKTFIVLFLVAVLFAGCKKENNAKLIFKFKFDPTQVRLT